MTDRLSRGVDGRAEQDGHILPTTTEEQRATVLATRMANKAAKSTAYYAAHKAEIAGGRYLTPVWSGL